MFSVQRLPQKIAALLVLALALFFHAYPFWKMGTLGDDMIYYQRMGLLWSKGDFTFSCPGYPYQHFRPAMFAVSGLF